MKWRFSMVDARLLVANDELYSSYVNMWGEPECRGHFLGQLHLRLHAPPANQYHRLASLPSTDRTGGFGVTGAPGNLFSVRNGGVLTDATGRISMELSDVAPDTEVLTQGGKRTRHSAPRRFAASMHNSIHPIWVPEFSSFLGVVGAHPTDQESRAKANPIPVATFCSAHPMPDLPPLNLPIVLLTRVSSARAIQGHRHYQQGTATGRRMTPNAPFQYGFSYRHIFFTFHPSTKRIVSFSREFCLPALNGTSSQILQQNGTSQQPAPQHTVNNDDAPLAPSSSATLQPSSRSPVCEGVQFVMSAFRQEHIPGTISFTYGINDCESGLLTLSVAQLETFLEFGHSKRSRSSGAHDVEDKLPREKT